MVFAVFGQLVKIERVLLTASIQAAKVRPIVLVTVTVQGHVTTERDLAEAVSRVLVEKMQAGALFTPPTDPKATKH